MLFDTIINCNGCTVIVNEGGEVIIIENNNNGDGGNGGGGGGEGEERPGLCADIPLPFGLRAEACLHFML